MNVANFAPCWRTAFLLCLVFCGDLPAQPAAPRVVDASTMNHKLLMGYQGWFACPGDWYLRLANEAGKMLRGEILMTKTMPITP